MNSLTKRAFSWLGFAIAGLIAGLTPWAQAQAWIRQFGTNDHDGIYALVADGAGGVMIGGTTRGSLGGASAGGFDAYLARYDSAGERLWIRQFGTGEHEAVAALAPDRAGGVFVAGWTSGSLGGRNAGLDDAFLARYDSAGSQLWIRQFGKSNNERIYALAPDGAGGVLVAGHTLSSLGGPNAGRWDVFLARFDSTGNQLWIRQFGTSTADEAYALAADGAGGTMVAGRTLGSLGRPNAGADDAFLARFDSAGKRLWIRQFGTSSDDVAYALAPDGAGGVTVAGYTGGSLGGPIDGGFDVFLARYDSAGERLWIRQFGTGNSEVAFALSPDRAGGVFVAGYTYASLGGPNAGSRDAFLAGYDSAGERLMIRQFGTGEEDYAAALAPNGAGGVIVAGSTRGSLDGANAGGWDAFLAGFGACDPCDMNCDGTVDVSDIEFFIDILFNGATPCDSCTGDTNGDGGVDAGDIEGFIDCLFP